jgi:hypothetical protein
MAGREDEAEEIVPDLVVDRRVQFQAFLRPLDITSDLFVLALERLAAPDQVDRVVFCGPHEPGARPLRHAIGGPLLERGDEGVLRELLCSPDVADDASQPGDEPGRLDPPDRFDRAMHLGGSCRGRASLSRSYGETSVTRPRAWKSRGPRRSRRRTVPASTIRGPPRSSAPATASTRPRALWSPRTVRR